MREIKFRQRNKNNGSFWIWGFVKGIWRQPIIAPNYESPEKSDQFTGLLDKNGAEIYEGDIIRVEDSDKLIFEVRGVNSPVTFSRGAFRFKCFEGFEKVLDDGSCLEVVGDIHEPAEEK